MDLQIQFGLRLRQLRKEQGLSQEALAFDADIDRSYITSVENGKRNVSAQTIEKILTALQISLKDFFDNAIFQEHGNLKEEIQNEHLRLADDTTRLCPNCGHINTKKESLNKYTCKYCEGEPDTNW